MELNHKPGIGFDQIKAFAFDIDGVMTNGGLLCDLRGELFRVYDAKDGFAVRMATMNGFHVGIITGGRSGSIIERFKTCSIPQEDIYLGSRNKLKDFDDFCSRHGLQRNDVLYIGDDIPDIEVIKACGIGACPSDAVAEVIDAADLVTDYPGGKGCVRSVFETVMKCQGRWNFDVNLYTSKF